MFLHYGLYSIPSGEWEGSTGHGASIRATAEIPRTRYQELIDRWDPSWFDADQLARTAKEAGMGYIVFTAKYHDGFCLFDSRRTRFDVMSTKAPRDLVGEMVAACRRNGLGIGLAYSIMDWNHEDYLPNRPWDPQEQTRPPSFARYLHYVHSQIAELLDHYGPIDILWFDGAWENTWTEDEARSLLDLCRTLQPSMLVNNRIGQSRGGRAGLRAKERFLGDFCAPEGRIPMAPAAGVPWEICIPLSSHWGWDRDESALKSAADVVRALAETASKGGNLLLEVPMQASGSIPPAAVERLRGIGAWMRRSGESVRGTLASPFGRPPFGHYTFRPTATGGRLYAHVLEWPEDGVLRLPGVGNEAQSASALCDPPVAVPFQVSGDGLLLQVGPAPFSDIDPVIAVDLLGPPLWLRPTEILAPAPIFVNETRVEAAPPPPGLEIRYTLDGTVPTAHARIFDAPILLTATTTVTARTFRGDTPVAEPVRRTFRREEPRPCVERAGFLPGLTCLVYEGDFAKLPDFASLSPAAEVVANEVALPPGPSPENQARVFEGFLKVPADDVYLLALRSDDGSRLFVDGEVAADNDGLHGLSEKTCFLALGAGPHPIRIEWFNRKGSGEIGFSWARAGAEAVPVPSGALVH
ncbi:MAG: hypothetical protein Fur0037_14020 [Planctomycetota bacterium]